MDYSEENAMVRSIALMSTLATAADVVSAMTERRLGRDPAAQEDPEVAAAFVRRAVGELQEHLLALRASRVLRDTEEASRSVALSRHVNEVMILNYLARILHVVHQRMLSLYPAVTEELVEEARLLQSTCSALRDTGEGDVSTFVSRTQNFCDVLPGEI